MAAPLNQPAKPKALKQALAACRGAFLALTVFSAAINLLLLASSFYMIQVYDRVLNSRSIETLVLLTLITLFAFAVMAALDFLRSRLMVRVSGWLDARLGGEVLAASIVHVLRGGERSAQALRDLATFRTFLTGPSFFPVMDAPWVPFYLAVNFLLHPLLGVLSTAGAIVLFLLALASEWAARGPIQAAGIGMRQAQQHAEMSVRNADVIESMGMMPALVRRWQASNAEAIRLQAIASDRAGLISAITKFVRVSLQSVVLGMGAWLVIEHEASGGFMIGASIIMSRALAPIELAIGSWRSMVAAREAYQRIKALLTLVPARAAKTQLPVPMGELSVEGLIYTPPGLAEPIIRGVSFALEAGTAMALIGPSAAGKTTLARLIVGSWKAQRGQVRLDGADLAQWDPDLLGPHLGYLPQDVELFSGTVRDNIARMGEGSDALVIEAAERAHAHEMILSLPRGYDTEIGDGGAFLSGGQRQRIGLARALYGNPKLIVLDEPNASLDSSAENRLLQTLFALKAQKTTLILITHRINLVGLADKVMVLKGGVVDLFGPRDEVVARLTRGVGTAATGGAGAAVTPLRRPADAAAPTALDKRSGAQS